MISRLCALNTVALALWNNNILKITSIRTLSTVNRQHNMSLFGQQIRNYVSSNIVKHSVESQQFYKDIDNDRAYISYNINDNVITLKETFVPIKARSGGFAKVLAESAFQYVEQNNLKAIIECNYLLNYLKNDGKKFKHLVINEKS